MTSTTVETAFDELKRRLDALVQNPSHDNEATRHDRLVVPFLTNPLLLGWDLDDLVAQATIAVPNQLRDSHIFRKAEPRSRKPDILVASSAIRLNAFVVEEKDRQPSIDDLNGYRFQLHEYQSLYECVWGLLTDGNRWILKKGFETFHTFDSLDDLRSGLSDIQHCIGKQSLLTRQLSHGTCDLVIVVPGMSPRLADRLTIRKLSSQIRNLPPRLKVAIALRVGRRFERLSWSNVDKTLSGHALRIGEEYCKGFAIASRINEAINVSDQILGAARKVYPNIELTELATGRTEQALAINAALAVANVAIAAGHGINFEHVSQRRTGIGYIDGFNSGHTSEAPKSNSTDRPFREGYESGQALQGHVSFALIEMQTLILAGADTEADIARAVELAKQGLTQLDPGPSGPLGMISVGGLKIW